MTNENEKDSIGPYIVWEDYGTEGWQPKSFANLTEALNAQRTYGAFVVTKRVEYEVVEKKDERVRNMRSKTGKRRGRGVAKAALGRGLAQSTDGGPNQDFNPSTF